MQDRGQIVEDFSNPNHDRFMHVLLSNKKKLEQCQYSNGLKSCLQCKKVLTCGLRSSYVDSVYDSMSKGQSGDFDFN